MYNIEGKEIKAIKAIGTGGLWKVAFTEGGQVADVFDGLYTSEGSANVAIEVEIGSRKSRREVIAKKEIQRRGKSKQPATAGA